MNSNYRVTATLYSIETWFFFRYVCIYTLQKIGNDDDDDNNNNVIITILLIIIKFFLSNC
jgi:hypothetical protein